MRDIQTTHNFDISLSHLRAQIRQIDEFIEGARFVLSRFPTRGYNTGRHNIFGLPMTEIPNNPKVILYYIITETIIFFIDVRVEGDTRPFGIII